MQWKQMYAVRWLLLVLIVALTGCWDSKELNQISFMSAIAIDQKEDQFIVTAQVVNTKTVDSEKQGKGAPIFVIQAKGQSVLEAFRRMTKQSPRKLNGSHLSLLVIGEETAKNGIADILDFFARDPETRMDFNVIIAKGNDASMVMNILTPQNKISALSLLESLNSSQLGLGVTTSGQLDEIVSKITSNGMHEPVISGLDLVKPIEETSSLKFLEQTNSSSPTKFIGIGVFKGDKLLGWLNEQESIAFSFIDGKLKSTAIPMKCPNNEGMISVEVIRSNTKLDGKVINHLPSIHIQIYIEGNVVESTCIMDFTTKDIYRDIEKDLVETMTASVEEVIQKVQKKYNADIFGFGGVIFRKAPKKWEQEFAPNWSELFKELDIKVDVEVKIRRSGTRNKTLRSLFKKEE